MANDPQCLVFELVLLLGLWRSTGVLYLSLVCLNRFYKAFAVVPCRC